MESNLVCIDIGRYHKMIVGVLLTRKVPNSIRCLPQNAHYFGSPHVQISDYEVNTLLNFLFSLVALGLHHGSLFERSQTILLRRKDM